MNIEPVIIDFLKTKLDTSSVYGEVQEKPEDEYFIIDKTGSGTENRITTSTIAIQSYAKSKARASDLNEQIKGAMDEAVILRIIDDCQLVSDYNFTDIATKRYRYQAVFEVTHR